MSALAAATLLLALASRDLEPTRTIAFPSADELKVTADVFECERPDAAWIVLFHQARWSRGEYRSIAPELVERGFHCLAVDLRSGLAVERIGNETALRAKEKGLGQEYLDALPDMEAALRYVRTELGAQRVLAWGSSYSASLVLTLASEQPDLIDAVVAVSPGEYFAGAGKSKSWVTDLCRTLPVPVFFTSAKGERLSWLRMFKVVRHERKASYLPEETGHHGSQAFWPRWSSSAGYWKALDAFLDEHFGPASATEAAATREQGE